MMYVVECTFRCKKSVLGGRRVGMHETISTFVTSPYSVVLCGVVEVEQVLYMILQATVPKGVEKLRERCSRGTKRKTQC